MAESLNIPNLPEAVASALASDVEYRIQQVVEVRNPGLLPPRPFYMANAGGGALHATRKTHHTDYFRHRPSTTSAEHRAAIWPLPPQPSFLPTRSPISSNAVRRLSILCGGRRDRVRPRIARGEAHHAQRRQLDRALAGRGRRATPYTRKSACCTKGGRYRGQASSSVNHTW